ncbi:response regulator [Paraburkholderia aspalathi]|uniref:CheY chemotaxis protein or a CheY-like REC (Receiver) domain n=1 Tax=Paraburkholderia aspalathi TaxID=1324617 RepID=A0A1I7EPY4_9BURK|nr:response regulator [Paraburkholderia aspalathi]SFU25992.1 CheY chemotaxis protein or a CheY-like REC (receiver) domain [Paraburkholderia aspalathi]
MTGFAKLLKNQKILVVEDDYLVALALSTTLEEAGASVVGPIARAQDAVMLIEEGKEHIDVAILDVDLNGEKSYAVADALALRHIRFVFATGYGVDAVDRQYRQYPRCQKPFDHQALFRALMVRGS